MQTACRQLYAWKKQFATVQSLHISINLSGRQIKQFDFVDRLKQTLVDTGLNGSHLRLELTETMLFDRSEKTIDLLSKIKEHKVQLSVDDFGTGYSSLSYLHRFPIDALKIDRSFVSAINTEGRNSNIVKTIITLAHTLGIKAIAEGVETKEQLNCLRQLDCDEVQGYLFSKPIDARSVEKFFSKQTPW
jgi:EAL domain-containing protein (putative c-di-GMP-specific phosphodiesterase class I)